GSEAGAMAAAVYRRTMTADVRETVYRLLRRQPLWCILIAFGIGQGVVALMPFTVSMTVSDLKRSVQSANVVPFDYQPISQLVFHRPNQPSQKPFNHMQFVEQLLFWAPLGYVLMLCRRFEWSVHRRGWLPVLLLPIIYFSGLEFLQLFIISRITDINDMLSGYLGIACGIGLYSLLRRVRWSADRTSPEGLCVPLCLYGVFVAFTGLQPFDWLVAPEARAWNLRWVYLMPFYSYYGHTRLSNLSDLIGSLTILLPIALTVGYRRRQQGDAWMLIFAGATLAGLVIGLAIEGLQLLSPSRTGDITDVLAYSSSGMLGASLLYYYEQEIQPALATRPAPVLNVHTGSAL
ncbi:MAG: VanZ family protein, partial [Candidatus Tectomicrobia bacterium]|nr:VanZ family protein [Candidatus Tectomicrobia bacterium]